MILNHYSKEILKFDSNRIYPPSRDEYAMKPIGFWLSDDSREDGWVWWCSAESFRLDYLRYQTPFEVDDSNILHLAGASQIVQFTQEWGKPIPGTRLPYIDWDGLKEKYSGIVISPYCWSVRLELLWYYSWDFASACIWDLSILKPQETRLFRSHP